MKNQNFLLRAIGCSIFCILSVFFSSNVWTFTSDDFQLPIKSSGRLSFYVDVCQFAKIGGGNKTEISYYLNISQFLPDLPVESSHIDFNIDLTLTSSQSDTLSKIHEHKSVKVDSTFGNDQYSFIDLKTVELRADTVNLEMRITNPVSNLTGTISKRFAVKNYNTEFSLSDLSFASYVTKSVESNNFEKNGLMVVPNPLRAFTYSDRTLNAYVYFEINNLSFIKEKPSFYSVTYKIETLARVEIATHTRPTIQKTSANCARFEIIPLNDLKPGLYLLTIFVTDLSTTISCSTSRYFENYATDAPDNMLLSMTDGDIENYYNQIKYIATHDEKEIFTKLNKLGKQEFLLNFWKARDPNPQTDENEFMQDYFRRYNYAKEKFNGGLNSDMGRIYLQYGEPLDIKRQFSSTESNKPVEIWYYAIEGTTEFIFVDRSGDGHYVLVHSNHRDEYQNPGWMNEIK
ncbi:GWxTD domain-containing protein [candidate division KSB1 bacterium]|nr:GWxTD domain-containing protein [candidate division KSB1 bacterium]